MEVDLAQQFATTHWSMVLRASDPASPGSAQALEALCLAYWYPLYAFVRRRGWSPQDAEDLTQAFFTKVLEKDYLIGVGPEKGRFRTFLLVCMKRFLANEIERANAMKRGGGKRCLSIDLADAEGRYLHEPFHDLDAERIYDRRWALTVIERALAALAEDLKAAGKSRLFEALKGYLVADDGAGRYADVAAGLRISESSVKVTVHRLRQRFRQKVVAEIAATVDNPDEVNEEIDRLFEVLGGG
jgi:RNA polymerase sigma factor (sigma-70 family)